MEGDPRRRQALDHARVAGSPVWGMVARDVHVAGPGVRADRGDHLAGIAGPNDERRAQPCQVGRQGSNGLQQEPGPGRAGETPVQQAGIQDEQGHDPIVPGDGGGQRRVVVQPKVAPEPDDGGRSHRPSFAQERPADGSHGVDGRCIIGRCPLLVLPDPSLVVLIGAAGSGKSTFAARHFAPDEILSSDALRAAISGDAADQSVNKAAFRALHAALDRRLRTGRLTVVDATNVTREARRALLDRAAAAGIPAVAIVLDLAPDLVLARNAARPDRVVPETSSGAHLDAVRDDWWTTAAPASADGFASRSSHPARTPADGARRWSGSGAMASTADGRELTTPSRR